ncbi:hypothetical protein RhiirC2_775167 [Rhizophagus irregularis]|uniref:Uncharacterized protein n=1 Tax=Rhizophagus irregularis TaxID=588596 RepID=A0A2N1NJY0_9GLOM|nr:hypothetical protein RhiirC2_775167 [Rhizophagus irregularis]
MTRSISRLANCRPSSQKSNKQKKQRFQEETLDEGYIKNFLILVPADFSGQLCSLVVIVLISKLPFKFIIEIASQLELHHLSFGSNSVTAEFQLYEQILSRMTSMHIYFFILNL